MSAAEETPVISQYSSNCIVDAGRGTFVAVEAEAEDTEDKMVASSVYIT